MKRKYQLMQGDRTIGKKYDTREELFGFALRSRRAFATYDYHGKDSVCLERGFEIKIIEGEDNAG